MSRGTQFMLVALVLIAAMTGASRARAQNPAFPGYLGVYVYQQQGGMSIRRFIPETPAAELARQGEMHVRDVILKLGGRSTPTMRRLLDARNRIPDGYKAKMVLRSRQGYIYHVWISRNDAAPASAPLEYQTGGRGAGDADENFRRIGSGTNFSFEGSGDFRPQR